MRSGEDCQRIGSRGEWGNDTYTSCPWSNGNIHESMRHEIYERTGSSEVRPNHEDDLKPDLIGRKRRRTPGLDHNGGLGTGVR